MHTQHKHVSTYKCIHYYTTHQQELMVSKMIAKLLASLISSFTTVQTECNVASTCECE